VPVSGNWRRHLAGAVAANLGLLSQVTAPKSLATKKAPQPRGFLLLAKRRWPLRP